MKITDPKVEFITEPNPLKRIELCGRVCYKSEDRITADSALKFVEGIIARGHTSVLEHARIKVDRCDEILKLQAAARDPGLKFLAALSRIVIPMDFNLRDYLFFFPEAELVELGDRKLSDQYATVRFICDRGIANELVRHRVFSFSQESTRYVSYKDGIEFIRPLPFEWAYGGGFATPKGRCFTPWHDTCRDAEHAYKRMIEAGCKPQEARNVLPLSTKTELVMTGTFDQWRAMLKLRTASTAHPQMRYLMKLLLEHPECPEEMKDHDIF